MEEEEQKNMKDNKTTKNEVVLRISNNEENSDFGGTHVAETSSYSPQFISKMGSSPSPKGSHAEAELMELENLRRSNVQVPSTSTFLARSEFSKPKSRMVEPPFPKDATFVEEKTQMKKVAGGSPRDVHDGSGTVVTPRTSLIGTPRGKEEEDEDDDDDEEVYKTAEVEVSKISGKQKRKLWSLIELFAFVCILGFLIATLIVHRLQHKKIWSLELWKWCVVTLVIISGRLVTSWFISVLVFLIERNFLFKKKVLYFVYGVRKSVQAFIWLCLVLLAWRLIFHNGVKRTRKVIRVLDYITRALGSCVIASAIWLAKTLLIKLLSSHFQSSRFFDRVQESIFHQYILRTLSGPPLMEMAETVGKSSSRGRLSFKTLIRDNEKKGKKEQEQVIDVDKLKKMKQEKVSAWTMKGLINVIRSSGLSTISYTPESIYEDVSDNKDNEITSEWEAKAAAYRIFRNVAKPGSKCIEKDDLWRFMRIEEVENLLPLFEGAVETGRIKRKSLKNWLVKVYLERRSLVHSLNDAKTAVDELNNLASAIVLVLSIIVWLLVMGLLTTQVLVFISSQLLLVVFVFGNTAKTVFEAIIFVFVMHPFDVGDRCVIDGVQVVFNCGCNYTTIIYIAGKYSRNCNCDCRPQNPLYCRLPFKTTVNRYNPYIINIADQEVPNTFIICISQMIVEEMNILTTIFLRYDNEKIFYPNSVLATKPISNFYRSPEMSDSVEFAVDVSTSIESIGALKTRLKAYLESRPQHWRPNHNVIVKDIENVNKMKMALYVNHTINFQNYTDKSSRRSELVLEMKKIFEDLDIKYHLLPQEVQLGHVRSQDHT